MFPPPTPPHPLPLGEPKFTVSAEHHLKKAYEHEIGLKMLEMAILKTQILKILWGARPKTPLENPRLESPRQESWRPESDARGAPLLKFLDPPLHTSVLLFLGRLTKYNPNNFQNDYR